MATSLERIHPRNLKNLANYVQSLIESRLWAKILLGILLGVAVGVALGPSTGWVAPDTADIIGNWIALPGRLFLMLVQMIIVPLVLASVIRGIASASNAAELKKTGLGLAIYFVVTTILATGIGIGLAYLVKPGTMVDPELTQAMLEGSGETIKTVGRDALTVLNAPERILGILPQNPMGAMLQGDMLKVVLLALIIGIALISVEPESARPLMELFHSIQKVCMAIVGFVMHLAPVAVFGLLGQALIRTGVGILVGLGVYAATVIAGLLALLGLYLLIAAVLGRQHPIRFLSNIKEPLLLAFSTGSSAATMPVSIRAAEDNLKVSSSTAGLVIPIGATMNMGGTACYHGLATVFMAQLFGMDLPMTALLALIVTSLGSSIGAPATPGAGIMILSTVLTAAGVPLAGLALIIGLDQILERVRCVMNVAGDLVACTVLDKRVESSTVGEAPTQPSADQEAPADAPM